MTDIVEKYRSYFPHLTRKEAVEIAKENVNKYRNQGLLFGVVYNPKTKKYDAYSANGGITRGLSHKLAKEIVGSRINDDSYKQDPGENFLNNLMFDVASGARLFSFNPGGAKATVNLGKDLGKATKEVSKAAGKATGKIMKTAGKVGGDVVKKTGKAGVNFAKGTAQGARDFFYDTTELLKGGVNSAINVANKKLGTSIPQMKYLQRNLPGGYFRNGNYVTKFGKSENPGLLSYTNKWILPTGVTIAADTAFNEGLKALTGKDWALNVSYYTGMPEYLASWTDPVMWWAPYRYMQANKRALYNQVTPMGYVNENWGSRLGGGLPSKTAEVGKAMKETAGRVFWNPKVEGDPAWVRRIKGAPFYNPDEYSILNTAYRNGYQTWGYPNLALLLNRVDAHALQFGQKTPNAKSIYIKNPDGTFSIDRDEVYKRALDALPPESRAYAPEKSNFVNPDNTYFPYIGPNYISDNISFNGARMRGGKDNKGNFWAYDKNDQTPFESMGRLETEGKLTNLLKIGNKLEPTFNLSEFTRSFPFVMKHKVPAGKVHLWDDTPFFKGTDPTWAYKDYGKWGVVPTAITNEALNE